MSHRLSAIQAALLGLVVCAGLALGVVGLFLVGGRGWYGGDAFHVRAAFTQIRGVEVGTRVRLKGMDVGEVVAIQSPERPEDPVVLRLLLKGESRRLVRPDSVVRIDSEGLVGGKVLEIRAGKGKDDTVVAEDQLLQGDATDIMDQVTAALNGVQEGKGSLGKFVTDTQAHDAFVDLMKEGTQSLRKGQETMTTLQEDAEAIKKLPLVGGYVVDPSALLERYNWQRDRRVFDAKDLFEPGRAVLTAQGKQRLDAQAAWLEGMKHSGSEVVIVAYADPHSANPQAARALTRQQSETACDYLKKQYAIQKMGWFSSRKVTPLGMGVSPPPLPETDSLPPDRVEVQVFTP